MELVSWKRVKVIFHEALDQRGATRADFLADACRDDLKLRAEVEALLAAHDEAGGFMGSPTLGEAIERANRDRTAGQTFIELQKLLTGRYSLERELGRGGMGVVYLARDVALDRPVAIKLLHPELNVARRRERFLQEARTAAGLSHPNIVPIHAVEEHDNFVFFVMAFVQGETLEERMKREGVLPTSEATRVLQEVAWALGHAHQRGIVHRDVKPANIILEQGTGRAMVADFGIAHVLGAPSTTSREVIGTVNYMSPEQASGGSVDARSDLYSLGVTSFYALTGGLPFEADSVQGMLTKHLHELPVSITMLRPDVPRKLARAIDRCLEKDPESRFESAEELAEAVSEARAQMVELPAAIREVRREVELLVMDGLGWGAISTILFLDWVFLGDDPLIEWGIKIGVYLLGIGLVASRAMGVITASRAAIAQGFGAQHLRSVLFERTPDGDNRSSSSEISGLRRTMEASAFLVSFVVLALGYMFVFGGGDNPVRGIFRAPYFFAMMAWNMSLLMLPVFAGRMLGARALRRWKATRRFWARLWQGRMGKWVFRLAGIGLGKRGQAHPTAQPTETLIAVAAADLFSSLPTEYQDRLGELPELVTRLEADADALRRREAELERAVAGVGTVGRRVDQRLEDGKGPTGTGDYGSVQAHRTRVVEDLDTARSLIGARLTETIAALENIRLGLLRLQAGVGTPDELTADLRAAREIGHEVQALLDGERQVEEFLSKGDESADLAPNSRLS